MNASQYAPGSITIDAVSVEPGIGLVWRGIAAARVDTESSPQRIERAIRDTVR